MLELVAIGSLIAALAADEETQPAKQADPWSEFQGGLLRLGELYPNQVEDDFHLVVSPLSWPELRTRLKIQDWIHDSGWAMAMGACPFSPGERALINTADGMQIYLQVEGWSHDCEKSAVPYLAPTLLEAGIVVLNKWKEEDLTGEPSWRIVSEEPMDDYHRVTWLIAVRRIE